MKFKKIIVKEIFKKDLTIEEIVKRSRKQLNSLSPDTRKRILDYMKNYIKLKD